MKLKILPPPAAISWLPHAATCTQSIDLVNSNQKGIYPDRGIVKMGPE
jgi:hypothetical protein